MLKNKFLILNNLVHNKTILCFFTFVYVIFSIYIINQYSVALGNVDFYKYFFGDGEYHIRLVNAVDAKLNLNKIHYAGLYYNNYYIFSLAILKLLKIFPGFDYTLVGISAVIINLISIYTICIACYLICYNLSKSKFFSIGIVCLLWSRDLLHFSLRIYPDILQLSLIFLSVYFVTINNKYKWLLSFIFCGLAFGVKAQGLLIFIYLISFYFFYEYCNNLKRINTKVVTTIFLYTFLYTLIFLITFFSLNQLDPYKLAQSILSAASKSSDIQSFDNTKIVYNYFIYLLRDKTNFIIFIAAIILNLFLLISRKKIDILFYVSLVFLILFYYQISNFSKLVQGPRYLYHFLPLIIICISSIFNNIREYLNEKNLKIIPLLCALLVFGHGIVIFKNTFFNILPRYDFKTKIKKDDMVKGYNFFKENIKTNIKNPLVCAGVYSLIPMNFSKNISKHYQHLNYEKNILNKDCEYILLDSSTPGRYIWFKEKLDNLIIPKYEKLSNYTKLYGKEKIEKTQELIKYLLQDPRSGYVVTYYNRKIIILSKK